MRTVLVTGGTGTLGRALVTLLCHDPSVGRIRILSRGEHKQMEMERQFPGERIDYLIGDVRDADRLRRASHNCNSIFHLAAFKSVDKAEYDPWECIQTNVKGTYNVIQAAIENNVSRCVFTSTDKAVSPVNIYGASKLCAEKLWIQGNVGVNETAFSACRYGNVLGSNGSVVQRFEEQNPDYQITSTEMTRFWIGQEEAAKFVLKVHDTITYGGEVYVPKMKSSSLVDLLEAFENGASYTVTGIRPGEKTHEVLISDDEVSSGLVSDAGWAYVIRPATNLYPTVIAGDPYRKEVGFNSNMATRFTIQELEDLIDGNS